MNIVVTCLYAGNQLISFCLEIRNLDEPEAALSPTQIMRLMHHMGRLVDDESQFIVSTHSPMIMAFPGADVILIDEGGFSHVDYRETEHYQVMRRFLEDPERMLRYLFE